MIVYNIDYSKNEKQLDKFQYVELIKAAADHPVGGCVSSYWGSNVV